MKTRSKILATVLATALLVTGTVFGTMAYLTDKDTVTNTMTVGNIDISLDETETGTDGKAVTPAARTQANTYKLIPGHSYTKDPTVHVTAGSEDSYIFITVDNGIAGIEAATSTTDPVYTNIAAQITNAGWKVLDAAAYSGVYYREHISEATDTSYLVFGNFKIKGDVDSATLANYKDKTIVVNAYAVQKDGFTDAKAAWAATFGAEKKG